MVDDAEYPEGLFSEARNVRRKGEINSIEVQRLADSIRLLENTVNELRKDILTIRGDMSDKV
ncbi:MAG: hypothetical protein AB1916_02530 [Thermodesulfobacteriota bacterium]